MSDTVTEDMKKAAQETLGPQCARELFWEEMAPEQKFEKMAQAISWYQHRLENLEAQVRELSLPHHHLGKMMVREVRKHNQDLMPGIDRSWDILNRNPQTSGTLGRLR